MITSAASPTRERILDAAVELFGRQGYHGTSVGEIERAAGLAPRSGALYKHFASKAALLGAAMERRTTSIEELVDLADQATFSDVRHEVRRFGKLAFREIGRDQQLVRIVMREGDNFPELRDRFRERIVRRGHEQATWLLRRLAGAESTAGRDLEALAAVVLSPLITYHVLETLFGHPPGDVDEQRFLATWTDSTLRLLESHGLLSRKQPARPAARGAISTKQPARPAARGASERTSTEEEPA